YTTLFRSFHDTGRSVGLNLTRATLDASCKYPWPLGGAPDGSSKFGYIDDDAEIFAWMREGATPGAICVEAQTMDLSDDIAYSVHDFEDAIVGEFIDPELLTASAGHEWLLQAVADWAGGAFTVDELGEAFDRIVVSENWLSRWQGSRADQAQLKNFTSDMIGRFARSAIAATLCEADGRPLARYGGEVI